MEQIQEDLPAMVITPPEYFLKDGDGIQATAYEISLQRRTDEEREEIPALLQHEIDAEVAQEVLSKCLEARIAGHENDVESTTPGIKILTHTHIAYQIQEIAQHQGFPAEMISITDQQGGISSIQLPNGGYSTGGGLIRFYLEWPVQPHHYGEEPDQFFINVNQVFRVEGLRNSGDTGGRDLWQNWGYNYADFTVRERFDA